MDQLFHSRIISTSEIRMFFQSLLLLIHQVNSCEVLVHEPWPMPNVFVPQNSTVLISCTTNSSNESNPLWSVNLASDESDLQLQFSTGAGQLNAHGVYELEPIDLETPGMPPTLRLLINDTEGNNGTEILCDAGNESFETSLYVYEPTALVLNVSETSMHSINISWKASSPISTPYMPETFLLTIKNGSSSDVITLRNAFYIFTALRCEVYNFSVTATYVGATYIGAGCSVPSPVLSRMLPSLPDTTELVSSLSLRYHLIKLSKRVILNIIFESAIVCGQYPILSYLVEVKSVEHENVIQSHLSMSIDSNKNIIVLGNLSENTIYSFRILVTNNVGVEFSDYLGFYTTDIQKVSAVTLGDGNTFIVQCDFITGSNAQGCMVVLVGAFGNATANLSRTDRTHAIGSIVVVNPTYNYFEVFGFDIEADGSVGSIAVPGQMRNISAESPTKITHLASEEETATRAILASLLGVSFALNFLFIIIVTYLKYKRKCSCVSNAAVSGNQLRAGVCSTENIQTTPNEVYGITMTASRLRPQ